MKILHINDTYKPIGGAETYLNTLMELQKSHGHDIYQMAIDDERELQNSRLLVYKDIYKRGLRKYFLWYFFNPVFYSKLRSWMKTIEPDVIHIHNNGKFTLTVLLAISGFNGKVVQTVHDCSMICPTATYTQRPGKQCDNGFGIHCAKNKCISWARYFYEVLPNIVIAFLRKKVISQFISPSRFLKEELEKNGFANVTFLPNFIDTRNIEFDPKKIEDGTLLFAGRLNEEKGILQLIEAMPSITKRYPDCRLDIFGDGPLKKRVIDLIRQLNLGNNTVARGILSRTDLFKNYQKAVVIIIPSISCENNPLVALEAMASGRPIIVSDIGGLPELVKNNQTGLLVKPMDIPDLCNQVLKFLTDKKMSVQLGKNARIFVEQFNPDTHYDKLIKIYQN